MRTVTKTLQMLMILFAFVFASQVWGQATLLTEDFETAAVGQTAPAGWGVDIVSGSSALWFQSAGSWPTCAPFSGTRFVEFQSFTYSSAVNRLKRTTPISTVGYTNVSVDFKWLTDAGYAGVPDRVEVEWSTNGSTWNTMAPAFNRYAAGATTWTTATMALPAGAQGQAALYIAFKFTSAYGNNCHLDLVHITAVGPPPPVTVTVGTGTSTVNYPYLTYWHDGRTQLLYTAAQIIAAGGSPGMISAIGFDVSSYATQLMNGFNIRLMNTTATTLTAWETGMTTVYSGTYAVPGTGWQMITLQTPFVWDGSNLALEICFDNTSYTSYSYVRGTPSMTGMSRYYYTDGAAGCAFPSSNAGSTRPNLRFVEQPYVGTLTGTVRNCYNNAFLPGVLVTCGTATATTNASGAYTIYNVAIGTYNVTYALAGFVGKTVSTVITNNNTTTNNLCLDPIPATVNGVVTNAWSANTIVGAKISVNTTPAIVTYSTANGAYTLNVYPGGTYNITVSKAGYDNLVVPNVVFVTNTTVALNLNMLQNTNAPGAPFTATLNTGATAVNLSWLNPFGNYEILGDDGTQENWTVWAEAGNQNAVKFTPVGYPFNVTAGKVNVGTVANYPGITPPLAPFKIAVMKADGPGGLPGTGIDTIDVTPTANQYGWIDFSFPGGITITSGDFYLVMIQGGIPPNAAGIAVDLTNPQLRSYERFVTGGAPWIPAAGNFMLRAIGFGPGGPLPPQNDNLITGQPSPGAIYQFPMATITGKEGVNEYRSFDWSTLDVRNSVPAQYTQKSTVPPVPQPSYEYGEGATFNGQTIEMNVNTDAVLFNNGPLVNSPGTGAGGLDESIIQAPLNSYGWNDNFALNYHMAEDFTVAGGQWAISSMDFYGYQTNSGNTSTFTGIYVQIWNGQPGVAGSTVVWGDMTTNRMASTSFANIYRTNGVNGGIARPIMKITANTAALTLNPGNYWVEWSATGSLGSGPWNPPITINNTPVTGNAILWDGTVWGPIMGGASATYAQGMPFQVNGTVSGGGGSLTYQVWRLKQGQEANEPVWTSLGTTNNTYMTDNSWPTLACAGWRWAAKVIYPGNRLSPATFSNVLGKCWTANVNVCVTLTCAANLPAGTIVKLVNVAYPDTNYTKTTDSTGCVHFTNVWKGDYTLTATRFTYPVYTQNITIMGDVTLNITMLQEKAPPTGLFVDDHSLVSTWFPPRSVKELFKETWVSGSFATNQWVEAPATSNWQMSAGFGNPAPSAMYNWSPSKTNYSETLTSKNIAGVHAPIQQLKYDVYLSNFGTTNINYLAVEIATGTTWTALKTYDNMAGNISWTSENLDISAWTHSTFKIRFRAYGVDSYDINNWNVDNIYVLATDGTSGPNPCVIGYNFYLNNILSAFTVDTTYTIPASQVVYGQTYTACVKAIYGSGYSDPNCYTFVSHFLCPVADLTATAVENSAYLTWSKPSCTSGEAKCYVYDDGTMENGWAFNPNYSRWLGNKFIAPATDAGTLTKFKMLWWNNGAATNQNFQIDVYSLAGVLLGSSQLFQVPIPAPTIQFELVLTTPIPFTGPFYGMIHWNMFTGSTHWFGYDQNGPYASQALGYGYDGTTFTPWNVYAGTSPGVFCLQACGLVSGDGPEVTFNPEGMPVGTMAAASGVLSHSPEGEAAPQIEPVNGDNAMAGTGLMGYNVYNHNGTFYQYVPGPDSLSTYVFNLDPGTYCFDVTAKYDLTVYGFPGTFGESIEQVGGPACVVLTYGRPLPFFEPWDQGSFGYNSWIFQPTQGNWSVNTGLGNPAPSADFSWQPPLTNYQSALVSPVIDASPWTCANIWLDFDYKLVDRNATGNEKMNVDVYYNGSWKAKLELTNMGSVNWTPQHIDITGVKGKAFRARFLANGANSADILHWYVDNIHMYGICKAPTALAATQSQFTTTLTWTPPSCGGGQVVMQFIFDDGTNENGWCINPGYLAFIGNEFPISATLQGVLQSFDLYFQANGSAGSAQPTIDVFDGTQTLVGSSAPFTPPTDDWLTVNVNDIPFAGMFYAMVKWDNFSAQTNYLGTDEDGPYSADDLAWYSDGATWDKLSVAAGSNLCVCLLRATALVGGDLKSVQLVPGAKPTQHVKAAAGTFSRSNRANDTYNHTPMGIQKSVSDSSTLIGYNVYRTDETGIGAFSKLNASPVTATTYVDTYPSTLEDGTFLYYVTVQFNDSQTGLPLCESPSDTIEVTFPAVGVNELTNGQIMVYPNPASELVNVKSDYTITGIDVINFVGQTVWTVSNVDAKTAKINVTSLRSGVYFVKVSTDQGIRTVKITVTR